MVELFGVRSDILYKNILLGTINIIPILPIYDLKTTESFEVSKMEFLFFNARKKKVVFPGLLKTAILFSYIPRATFCL